MTAKHTPGPWIHRTELGTVNAVDPEHTQDGLARIEICDPSCGQTWNGGMLPIDERGANANLIAAAPDLLAALEAMVATWEGPRELAALRFAKNVVDARAAIARARGE